MNLRAFISRIGDRLKIVIKHLFGGYIIYKRFDLLVLFMLDSTLFNVLGCKINGHVDT